MIWQNTVTWRGSMTKEIFNADSGQNLTDLDALIIKIDDEDQRKFILIMRSLVEDMLRVSADNSKAITEMGKRFDQHMTEYTKQNDEINLWKNQGKGMWKVAALVLVPLQGLMGIGVNYLIDKAIALDQSITEMHRTLEATRTQVSQLELEVKNMKSGTQPEVAGVQPRKRR